MDLVIGSTGEPRVVLLQGDGAGGFSMAGDVRIPDGQGGIADVVPADIDDGRADVTASNPGGSRIAVVPGTGEHGFGTPQVITVAGQPGRMQLGDRGLDGTVDLLVVTDSAVVALERDFNDELIELGRVPTATRAADMLLADVVGDGGLDLILALPDEDQLRIADDVFGAVENRAGDRPVALALGDFTGDSIDDVAVAYAGNRELAVYEGLVVEIATDPVITANVTASRLTAADMDGDGLLDLVALDLDTGVARVLLGNGDGSFSEDASVDRTVSAGGPAGGMAVADFNGDQIPDIVLTSPSSGEAIVALNTSGSPVCVGDCDGNGRVAVNEIVLGVNIALSNEAVSACPSFDRDRSGDITIDELVTAVGNGLNDCVTT